MKPRIISLVIVLAILAAALLATFHAKPLHAQTFIYTCKPVYFIEKPKRIVRT